MTNTGLGAGLGSAQGTGNDWSVSGYNYWSGVLNWSTTTAGFPSTFSTLCCSFNQEFYVNGSFMVDAYSLKGATISNLPALPSADTSKGETPTYFIKAAEIFQANIPNVTDNTTAAALQLAIWGTLYGSNLTPSITSGTTLLTDYQNDLNNVANNTNDVGWLDYVGASNTPQGQSQFVYMPNGQPNFTPVPEPFTMGLGIAGVGMAVRRKLRKTA
jgi:hypothetical protein